MLIPGNHHLIWTSVPGGSAYFLSRREQSVTLSAFAPGPDKRCCRYFLDMNRA